MLFTGIARDYEAQYYFDKDSQAWVEGSGSIPEVHALEYPELKEDIDFLQWVKNSDQGFLSQKQIRDKYLADEKAAQETERIKKELAQKEKAGKSLATEQDEGTQLLGG